jgi:exosortase family protein XrtM
MQNQNPAVTVFNLTVFRQFIVFIGCYWLLNYIYFQIPDEIYANVVYYYGVVLLCADLINAFFPLEHVSAVQNHLISTRADLEIVRGCDSAGVVFLMISAVLAFQAKFSEKLLGITVGIILIYILNIIRVTGLYFIIAYKREWFELTHLYLAPTLMTISAVIYFTWWAIGCRNASEPS